MTERDYGDSSYQRSSRNNSLYDDEAAEYRHDIYHDDPPPSRRGRSSSYRDRDYRHTDDYSEYSPRPRRGRRDYDYDSTHSPDDNDRTRGTRSKSRDYRDPDRRSVVLGSRSQSRGRALSSTRGPAARKTAADSWKSAALIGGIGGGVAIGKAIYDRARDKSRGRLHPSRSRSRGASSDDSYVPPRRQQYGQRSGSRVRDPETESVNTVDLEESYKKTRSQQLLTAAFVSIAALSTARSAFNNYNAHKERRQAILEGKMSAEDARKTARMNVARDAAAVAVCAIGVKSAYAEWKRVKQLHQQRQQLDEKRRKHSGRPPGQTAVGPGTVAPTHGYANSYHA